MVILWFKIIPAFYGTRCGSVHKPAYPEPVTPRQHPYTLLNSDTGNNIKKAHAVYENRTHTRDRSRIRHKKAKHHTGPQTGPTYISSPKIDSKKTTKNLIHNRNPGSNIRTPYEDQHTGQKPQTPG